MTSHKYNPPPWTRVFLASLQELPVVSRACDAAGVSRKVVTRYRKRSTSFAQEWDDALEDGIDNLERQAWDIAKKGDRQLMIFLLKSLRPARYRESYKPPPVPKPMPPMITFRKVPARRPDEDF